MQTAHRLPSRAEAHEAASPLESAGRANPATKQATRSAQRGIDDSIRSSIVHDLPHTDRLLLILWYAERMTPPEIGLVLDMAAAQVVLAHDRIVGALRRAVGQHATA